MRSLPPRKHALLRSTCRHADTPHGGHRKTQAARRAANLHTRRPIYTESELDDALRAATNDLGRTPTPWDYDKWRGSSHRLLPSSRTLVANGRKLREPGAQRTRYSMEELEAAVMRAQEALHHPPTLGEYERWVSAQPDRDSLPHQDVLRRRGVLARSEEKARGRRYTDAGLRNIVSDAARDLGPDFTRYAYGKWRLEKPAGRVPRWWTLVNRAVDLPPQRRHTRPRKPSSQ